MVAIQATIVVAARRAPAKALTNAEAIGWAEPKTAPINPDSIAKAESAGLPIKVTLKSCRRNAILAPTNKPLKKPIARRHRYPEKWSNFSKTSDLYETKNYQAKRIQFRRQRLLSRT